MAGDEDIFLRAQQRTYKGLTEDKEKEWKGPFYFIQAADPQLGLMKSWRVGDCDNGGDEWSEEVQLTKQAVQAINKLQPRPRFIALCGDLVHAMPGDECMKAYVALPAALMAPKNLQPLSQILSNWLTPKRFTQRAIKRLSGGREVLTLYQCIHPLQEQLLKYLLEEV